MSCLPLIRVPAPLISSFRRNLTSLIVLNALTGLAGLVGGIWFARSLGPGLMGQYATAVVLLQLVTGVLNAGFNQAVIFDPEDTSLYRAVVTATALQAGALIAIVAIALAAYETMSPESAHELRWPTIGLLVAQLLQLYMNLLTAPLDAKLAYAFQAMARLTATLCGIAGGVALALKHEGVYALVWRDLIISGVWLAMIMWYAPRRLQLGWDRAALRKLWTFSLPLWVNNVLEKLTLRLDYAIVGYLLGRDGMGIYFTLRGIVEGVLGFVVIPVQTIFYAYCCRVNDHKVSQLKPEKWMSVFPIGMILCVALALAFGEDVTAKLFGTAFVAGAALLPGFMLYAWAILWFEMIKAQAMSRNQHRHIATVRVMQLIGIALITMPLIRNWGYWGAGWASGGLAAMLALLFTVFAFQRKRTAVEIGG